MLSISLWSYWVVVFINAQSQKAGCRGCQFRERGQHGPPKPCTEELTWPRPQLYATAPIVTAAMTSQQVAMLSWKSQFREEADRELKSTEHTESEREKLHHGSQVWSYCLQGLPKALRELLPHLAAPV